MEEKIALNLQIAKEEMNKLIVYRESLLSYYRNIKSSLDSLEAIKEENVFLPLGNDVFVKSNIIDKNLIIVGIGSNIYIEMEIDKAKELLEKKIKKIEEEIREINMYIQNLQNYILSLLEGIKKKE
ncbi:MAG: prefoldin subunit alpha [Candidatus Aenigmatarchaeota archaeon]